MSNADSPNVWKVIRGLSGTLDTNPPNVAMSQNSCTITNTKSKANIFINHYSRVSKLHTTKEDRDLNCLLRKRLNTPSADNESCTFANISELLSAIQKMKHKGAACPDEIPPTFLKLLGPLALQELLSIFNASLHLVDCPRIWRVSIIIPLLKAGKSRSDVAYFRPISLTSCIVKRLVLSPTGSTILLNLTTSLVSFKLVPAKVEAVRIKYFELSNSLKMGFNNALCNA